MSSGGEQIHQRVVNRVPMELRCLVCSGSDYFEGTIRNIGEDGIYLECDREMRPGEKVRIHLIEPVPEVFRGRQTNESTGIVKWCKPPAETARRCWGVGIRLL